MKMMMMTMVQMVMKNIFCDERGLEETLSLMMMMTMMMMIG